MIKKDTSYETLKKSQRKKGAWFVPIRGSWLPISWQAWLSYIPFTGYLVFSLLVGLQQTKSTALAVLFIIPNWITATVAMTYLAKRTS